MLMNSNEPKTWRIEHSIETTASPAALWAIWSDVPGWAKWNAGIASIELEGPFADGTWFATKPPGEEAFRSKLLEVRANESFVDETRVGDLVVTVMHRIERLGPERTRVIYAVFAEGPDADQIGPAISADFPEVLAGLVALATGAAK